MPNPIKKENQPGWIEAKRWELIKQAFYAVTHPGGPWKFPEFREKVLAVGSRPTDAQKMPLYGEAYALKKESENKHEQWIDRQP